MRAGPNDDSVPIVSARLVTASQISHEDGASPHQRTLELEQQVATRREQLERERQRLLQSELEELDSEQRRLQLEAKDRLKQQRGEGHVTSNGNHVDSSAIIDLDEYEDEASTDAGNVNQGSKQNKPTSPAKAPNSLTQDTQTNQQDGGSDQSKQMSWVKIVLILIVLVLLGVGAFCGTGNCSSSSSTVNPPTGPTGKKAQKSHFVCSKSFSFIRSRTSSRCPSHRTD